jgi:hypothetical protein
MTGVEQALNRRRYVTCRIKVVVLIEPVAQARRMANGDTNGKSTSTSTVSSTTASVCSISRSRSPQSGTRASSLEVGIDPVVLGKQMRDLEEDEGDDQRKKPRTDVVHEPVDAETAGDWVTVLQRLNKGKMRLDRQVQVNLTSCLGRT